MSSSSPPTKPPRGVKSRETSGLLLTVIRTLSTSESNEQREHEKAKLEREYKRSDQQLNELVSKHKQELTHVMQLFGKVSNNITTTRDKLRGMKEILIACKTLLSCRREELKKLWLEGVEHKHILKLLDEIEQIKDVPSKLSTHLANREYLDAAKLLVSALSVGDGALEGVEALRELKTELHHKRELQSLLTDYLDIQNTSNEPRQTMMPFQDRVEDISLFFSRRRIQRVACTLNTFINDYIKNVFLSREYTRLKMAIEGATKLNDAWRTPTSPQVTADLNLGRPLLKSTVQVSDAVQDLEALLDSLPCHKSDVLDILIKLIRSYAETCGAAYRGIVHPGSEDKTLCSVSWLKDEDISRFLKSLPNWLNLQAQKPLLRNNRTLRREDTGEEESPEEIRQRNIKEAEILVGNLAEGGQLEIISDLQQLKSLGLLQESMEWFAWRMLQIANKSKKVVSTNDTNANLLADYAKSMNEISVEFEELANTCLLMLHLEVRVQCFHYLLPKNNNYGKSNKSTSQDPDPRVLELSRVLISIDEALSSSLQTRKIKYIFEGLGYLISKILMSTIRQMYKVDDLLIHKMCRNIFTLQQTLTNITMARDLSLDHARNYFQLFFLSPEEIMNEILEKRPDYSKAEITTVFMLISRSRGASEDIQKYVQRLTDVFGSAEFTV
ncbi:unnamed protein product [Nesidiocoris tenuis]|uniref:Exocyst complex component Sec8 n=1 Tax=Nesidiocoris tenuis TaxID=355587 RepID=A0A6H5G1A7_9HEMI|nr:unnamed protein product [Nesidiocoris tenuis]